MRKLIASAWMTLDGVAQAPSYADEDTAGGFERGGPMRTAARERSSSSVADCASSACRADS